MARQGWFEAFLGWALLAVADVIGAALGLSAIGMLGQPGYLLVHAGVFAACWALRRRSLPGDWARARDAWTTLRSQLGSRRIEGPIAVGFVVVASALLVVAAWAQPGVMDALTYHLPRAAQWLQDGRIHFLPTSDERLNFVTPLPEVAMGWFLTATPAGYALVMLPQAIGGIMTLVATIGLARNTGLSVTGAALAGVMLLGMQNVVAQFTACQTDLFTTGVFSAAFYLWWRALARNQGSFLGGLGLMLAVGSKGTLYYLAPTLLGWVGWMGSRHPLRRAVWLSTLVGAVVGVAGIIAPIWARNLSAYGSPFAPPDWTQRVHRSPGSALGLVHKIDWNLLSSLAQNCSRTAQPDGLGDLGAKLGLAIAEKLPEHDPFTLDGIARGDVVRAVVAREVRDVDATSFGLPALLLFTLGTIAAAVRWRRPPAPLIMLWAGGAVGFVFFLHGMQVWHPFVFRYLVLIAPWIAIVGASTIELCRGTWRWLVALLIAAAALDVGWRTTTETPQSGWRSIVAPQRALPWFVFESWREWSRQLGDSSVPLTLALPEERPLAAFYRMDPPRKIVLEKRPGPEIASAEEWVAHAPGWVIVPAQRFLGREGHVVGRTWLFRGDDASPFSLAAFRRLAPGEVAAPLLYRHIVETTPRGARHRILVKTWSNPTVSFSLVNPTAGEVAYRLTVPDAARAGRLAAGERKVLPIPIAADSVSEALVEFTDAAGAGDPASSPRVELGE